MSRGPRRVRTFCVGRLCARVAALIQLQQTLELETNGRDFYDLTADVALIVAGSKIRTGLAIAFCAHTSASLVIQENADPNVRRDLMAWLERAAPDGDSRFRHIDEGADDMPAHVRSAITKTTETIPIVDGRLALGTWQALYLIEHRTRPHRRRVVVHLFGERG